MSANQEIKERLTVAWEALFRGRRSGGVGLPVTPERTSQKDRFKFLEDQFTVDTLVPYDYLPLIKKMAISVPDMSQTLKKAVNLGNTGHRVSFEGLSERQIKEARDEIDLFAANAFSPGGGTDSLVNALFDQGLIGGALSVESVPTKNLDGIGSIVLVPVETIRFKFEDERYIPYQAGWLEDHRLNDFQYAYIPLRRIEDSPYGIPPLISAVDSIFTQIEGVEGIKGHWKKFSLLGFIHAKKTTPSNPGKSQGEYDTWLKERLKEFAKAFAGSFKNGAAVSYDDTSINYQSVHSESRGAKDIFELVEQQVASGMDIDPALLGRTYSTTETYAGVVYHAYLSQLNNIRRMIKRVLEKIYWLHLILKGYPVKRVIVTFNPDKALDPAKEEMALKTRAERLRIELELGIIDDDTFAREMGRDKAVGKKQVEKFESYEPGGYYPFLEHSQTALVTDEQEEEAKRQADLNESDAQKKFEEAYKSEIASIAEEAEQLAVSGISAEKVFSHLDDRLRNSLPEKLYQATLTRLTLSWVNGTKVTVDDVVREAQGTATQRLHDALPWFKSVQLYDYGRAYGSIASRMQQDVLDALEGKAQKRSSIRARAKYLAKKVAENMGVEIGKDRLQLLENRLTDRYRMVISGAVNKARNFSMVLSYQELGIKEIEYIAIIDQHTSDTCRTMHGRRIELQVVTDYVESVLSTPADQVVAKFPWQNTVGGSTTEQILASMPVKLPPFHGRCRTSVGISTETKIFRQTKRGGSEQLTGTIQRAEKKSKAYAARNKTTSLFVDGLRKDELLSKIRGYQQSGWDELALIEHWKKHQNAFAGIVDSEEAYESLSRRIIGGEFHGLYLYGQQDAGVVEPRFGFETDIQGRTVFVGVDPETGLIRTMHIVTDRTRLKRYMRID